MKFSSPSTIFSLLIVATLALPASGQSDRRSDEHDEQTKSHENARDQEKRDQKNRDQENQTQRDRQRRSSATGDDTRQRYRLQPQGWIGVAYDYDNDGRYEHADYIYYYDLQQARKRSDRRARDLQTMKDGERRTAQRGSADRQRRQQAHSANRRNRQQVRLTGEVTNMGIKDLHLGKDRQSDKEYRFAKIKTNSGRSVRVMLGSEEKVSQLDIREGDQIRVEGVRCKVNDKEAVLARRVSAGGNTITNELPPRQKWRRVSGTIQRVRNTNEGRDTRHTVIQLRGSEQQVDLGPQDELQDLDLQEGDQITLLARPGQIDGQRFLIAQKIRANGEKIDVREATNRSLSRAGDSRQR
mgnify:CR=1 FL=1